MRMLFSRPLQVGICNNNNSCSIAKIGKHLIIGSTCFLNIKTTALGQHQNLNQQQQNQKQYYRNFCSNNSNNNNNNNRRTADHSRSMSTTCTNDHEMLRQPIPDTMKHVSYTPGCTHSGLSVTESSPRPKVSTPDEVLIQVEYSGVGGTDLAQRRGNFNPKPGSPDHHLIMGLEVSGIVAEVGRNVNDFKIGDKVAALLYGGGYAQYAVVPQQQVLELPDNFSLEEGACVPENFWTVYTNLFDPSFGNLCDNPQEKTLLVHGGTGGIGSTAISLSKALGVQTVITTVSNDEKAKAAKDTFGADHVINYNEKDFVEEVMAVTDGHGADVVLCFLGGDYTPRNVAALAKNGRLVQLGLRRGKEVTFDFKQLMNKWGTITGGHLRPRTLEQKGATRDALREHVLPLWQNGTLPKPQIMKILSLEEAGKSHQMLEESKVIGKIVLKTHVD